MIRFYSLKQTEFKNEDTWEREGLSRTETTMNQQSGVYIMSLGEVWSQEVLSYLLRSAHVTHLYV